MGEDSPAYGIVGGDDGVEIIAELAGDPLHQPIALTGNQVRLADVRLLAPVLPRSKVVGIGRNYADHAKEMGGEVPDQPLMFLIPHTAVVGPDDPVVMPPSSQEISYEGELAVVIGRFCKDVPAGRAADVIFGYTCANDVTARDLQRGDGQWSRAKGMDTFCPLGPWIETVLDPRDLRLTTTVNGDVKQDGRTSQLVHDIPALIAYASRIMTLLPGDVIITGTPAGVGPIVDGDTVTIDIEGIGALTNPVRDKEPRA
jgi:2-keto-4-pentenoate hydratase/2-oxohepta-3-ene-1,7-dioic acid hydratase in catechol pathway